MKRNTHVMRHRQSGFTLIELAIVVAVIGILAYALMPNTSGGKSKAVATLAYLKQTGDNLTLMKNDTGCYTKVLAGLYDNSQNTASNTFCGQAFTNSWNGPYGKPFDVDTTTGAMKIDKLASGGLVTFTREAGGVGQRYYLHAANVPNEMINLMAQECTGSPTLPTSFATSKCRGTLGTTSDTGTFDYLVEETR